MKSNRQLAVWLLLWLAQSAMGQPAQVILLRHAEKSDDPADVHLTARGRERAQALVALLGLTGWFGVSRSVFPAQQIPLLMSGGLGGVFLLGVGSLLWLSADIRDEWRKLDELEEATRGEAPDATVTLLDSGRGRG